jgi:hypothetical protein
MFMKRENIPNRAQSLNPPPTTPPNPCINLQNRIRN